MGWREVPHCNTIVCAGIAREFVTAYTFGELYNYFQIWILLGKEQSVVILIKRPLYIKQLVVPTAGNPDGCLYKLKPKLSLKSKHIWNKQNHTMEKAHQLRQKNVDAWTRKGILKLFWAQDEVYSYFSTSFSCKDANQFTTLNFHSTAKMLQHAERHF